MNRTAKELMIFSKAMLSIHDTSDLLKFLNSDACAFLQVERINIVLHREQIGDHLLYYIDRDQNVICESFLEQNTELYNVACDDGFYQLNQQQFRYYYPDFTSHPAYRGVEHYCKVPLATVNQPFGYIEFINPKLKVLEDGEREFRLVNNMLVSFVAHVLDHEFASNKAQKLSDERDNYHILVDVTNAVISQSNKEMLLTALIRCLNEHFSLKNLAVIEIHNNHFVQYSSHIQGNTVHHDCYFFSDGSVFESMKDRHEAVCLNRSDLALLHTRENAFVVRDGIDQVYLFPLSFRSLQVGYIAYMRDELQPGLALNTEMLWQISARVAMAMHGLSVHEAHIKQMTESEYIPIEDNYDCFQIFDDIISQSEAMNQVLEQVAMVADCDSTVLLLGETGTGKELVARAIHKLSRRSHSRMVKMNCAAVPEGLFESELFGHERGAFTGAISQRVGRFEQANNGTLFLDEIGDMPLELQPKLLRALQESEIERVGRNQLISVDVRIIVATNADLLSMVENKSFRSDLYYRLNIFPIEIPPLRDRVDDIPLLVKHFTRELSKKMGKNITSITRETMLALSRFSWPGNVRQLRNFIERSVILTRGSVLNAPLDELVKQGLVLDVNTDDGEKQTDSKDPHPTITRDAIIQALKDSNGIVAGARGAAEKLGLKRTTLISRMQKMGISSKDYIDV